MTDYNEAMLEINEYLVEKDPKSSRGYIHALCLYKRKYSEDPIKMRACNVILNLYSRQEKLERFDTFLKEKSRLIKKKPDELEVSERIKFRADFERLEKFNKQ